MMMCRQIKNNFGTIKVKMGAIEKGGVAPDEKVLLGHRKQLQFITSCIRKIQTGGLSPPVSMGKCNLLISKINKWVKEGLGETGQEQPKKNKVNELAMLLCKMRPGGYTLKDAGIRSAIQHVRDTAKERIMSRGTVKVAKRARKLSLQRKRTEAEVEDYIRDKLVVPILTTVFDNFIQELELAHIVINANDLNFIETSIKGGKAIRDYVNLLNTADIK